MFDGQTSAIQSERRSMGEAKRFPLATDDRQANSSAVDFVAKRFGL
jgi:hypothetical protein